MHLALRLLLCAVLLNAASASEIKIPLVGLGWQVAFEGPVLMRSSVEYSDGSFKFTGNSGRFNATMFVEPPPKEAPAGAHTHSTCRDFFWPQAKRNPAILPDSVKQTTHPQCEAVTYRAKGVFQKTPYVQDHINCYFVYEGKWVDLHVSIIEPTAEDTKSLSILPSQLTHGPWQASKGDTERFVLAKLGTLTFAPPAGWLTGNVLDESTPEGPTKFTVSFLSPTDPNSNCLLTLFTAPDIPTNAEALQRAVEGMTQPAVSASVEGKAVVHGLKLQRGYGAVASFTDASLVGKPIEPGNTKALASGLIVPKPGVLGVVSMFMDDAQGHDAQKMLQTLETLMLD